MLQPTIFLAFAQHPDTAWLAALQQEQLELTALLAPLAEAGQIRCLDVADMSNSGIQAALLQHRDAIAVLHYGGHADGKHLIFTDGKGQKTGLAVQIALLQTNLKVLFLNGCATQGQVAEYLRQGIRAVIATQTKVGDELALRFARAFYEKLAQRLSIADAFTLACGIIEQQPGQVAVDNKIVYRATISVEDETDYEEVPYRLYVNKNYPEVLDWAVPPPLSTSAMAGDLNTVQYLRDPDRFVGRQEDLEALSMRLRHHHRVAVEGIGGIGKTTLLRAFCYRYGGDYDHKVWINGQENLINAFISDNTLNNNLHLPVFASSQAGSTGGVPSPATGEQKFSAADYFKLLMGALRQLPGRNLLIIDNAHLQILNEDVRRELPEPVLPGAAKNGWDILVSTREDLGEGQLRVFAEYPLHTLSPAAARDLFLRYHTPRAPDTEAELDQLLQFIDCHPLTVEIFAKSFAASWGHRNIQTLMGQLQGFQLDDAALPFEIKTEHAEEAKPFKHLLATFDPAGLSDDEKTLLKQLVFLPAIPIDLKTFENLVPGGDALIETLNKLSEKGWISLYVENERDKFLIHRMVAEMLIYALRPQLEEVTGLVEKVGEILAFDQAKDNPVDKFQWVPYGTALTRYFAASNAQTIARLNSRLAMLYRELGEYGKAAALLEKSLDAALYRSNVEIKYQKYPPIVQKIYYFFLKLFHKFGPDHPSVAARQSNLAAVYEDLGRYERAAELLQTALASAEKNFGPHHPNVAVCQSNLANVYGSLGRYERAAELLQTALASDLKNLGSDHPTMAVRQSNLATIYRDLGRYERAAELLQTALASAEKNFGPHHPNVAVLQSNLANVYVDLGSYERAAELLKTALASDLKNFGPDHPTVARNQSNLANVYGALGRFECAAKLFQTALASDLKNLGPEHPNVARSQSNLANVYGALGRFERAAELLQTALASDLKNFGPEHPNVARSQSDLANVYGDLGRYERAAELLETALASDLKNFGPEHPNVARSQSDLANVYGDLGRYERAAELLETALASDLKNFGPHHPNVARRQSNLANVYGALGRFERAAELLQTALASAEENFGPHHPNVAVCQLNLAVVYLKTGKKVKAKALFQAALQNLLKNFGPEHPNVEVVQDWLSQAK